MAMQSFQRGLDTRTGKRNVTRTNYIPSSNQEVKPRWFDIPQGQIADDPYGAQIAGAYQINPFDYHSQNSVRAKTQQVGGGSVGKSSSAEEVSWTKPTAAEYGQSELVGDDYFAQMRNSSTPYDYTPNYLESKAQTQIASGIHGIDQYSLDRMAELRKRNELRERTGLNIF